MYNVLTCDDEQIMVDSLQFIIKKNFGSNVNLFSCLSGNDAIQIASREKIDIVFMDINMSGMNGLDAISCILNLRPQTVVIMLSAFDEFRYAQQAMNLGAFKYLTKPVSRNVVIQTLRDAMNMVDKKNGSDDESISKKLDEILPIVENDFIYSCIFGSGRSEDFAPYAEYFDLEKKNYFFMCIEIPRMEQKSRYEISLRIRKIVSQKFKCLLSAFMVNRIAVFVPTENFSGKTEDEIFFAESVREIYTLLSIEIGQGIRAGVSRIFCDLKDASENYNDALSALNKTSADGEILFCSEKNSSVAKSEKISGIARRLFSRLKLGDSVGVKFLCNLYFQELQGAGMDGDKMKNSVFEILFQAKILAKSAGENFFSAEYENVFGALSAATNIREIQDFAENRLAECASFISGAKKEKQNPAVKKACAFVAENLAAEISLEEVSRSAGVSPFYLSKLFKEELGETFVNYVSNLRLEKAKKLLTETDLSIKEISAEIGYNDQNYFSRLFKNKFGASPKDFRNSAWEEK